MLFIINLPAATQIYTLSLHDALPILAQLFGDDLAAVKNGDAATVEVGGDDAAMPGKVTNVGAVVDPDTRSDRKSTRLNSSHMSISYAVFCLKKKKNVKASNGNPY